MSGLWSEARGLQLPRIFKDVPGGKGESSQVKATVWTLPTPAPTQGLSLPIQMHHQGLRQETQLVSPPRRS